MTLDWQRRIVVRVADLTISEPKIEFEIRRDSNETPAAGTVTLFNLARETEQRIEKHGEALTLSAGYAENEGIIYDGDIQRVERTSNIDEKTRTTKIELAPGKRFKPRRRFQCFLFR